MSEPGDLSASEAEHEDAKAVLHRALRFLAPLREATRTRPGENGPYLARSKGIAEILTATDRLRTSERLPAESFNLDLWPYVTDLKDLAKRQPETLDFDLIAEYLPFISSSKRLPPRACCPGAACHSMSS